MRVALLLVLALAVGGCGGPGPTGHGAAPYQTPTRPPQEKMRTHFPAEGLTFTLPAMGSADRQVAHDYIAFQVAVARTLRTNTLAPALRRRSGKDMQAMIEGQLQLQKRQGYTRHGPTRMDITRIRTSSRIAYVLVCAHNHGSIVGTDGASHPTDLAATQPGSALLSPTAKGSWRVYAVGKKKRLKGC